MIIYITTNNINGKSYIGKDSTNSPKYLGSGNLLCAAISKYGKENFTKQILEVVDISNCKNKKEQLLLLLEREIYWIDFYDAVNSDNFYNITRNSGCYCAASLNLEERNKKISATLKSYYETHDNPMLNRIHSTETKEKIKISLADKFENDPKYREAQLLLRETLKTNHPCTGRHHTDEEKAKIGLAHKNKIVSAETREKISIAAKNRNWTPEQKANHARAVSESNKRRFTKPDII